MTPNNVIFSQIIHGDNPSIKTIYRVKQITYGRFKEVHDYILNRVTFKSQRTTSQRNIPKSPSDYASTRTKQKIIQIIEANHTTHATNGKTVFATLTFKQQYQDRNITDKKHRYFIERLTKYLGKKPKYISVPEQLPTKAWHYHIVFFELPFIPKEQFEKNLWTYGFTNIQLAKNVRKITSYVGKYITKDIVKNHPKGKKRYLASRNLIRPVQELLFTPTTDNMKLVSTKRFSNKIYKKYKYVSSIHRTPKGNLKKDQ